MSLTQRQKAEQLVVELEKYFAKVHSDKQCPFGVALLGPLGASDAGDIFITIACHVIWRHDPMVNDTQFEVATVLDRWVEKVVELVTWTPRAKQACLGGLLRLDPAVMLSEAVDLPEVVESIPEAADSTLYNLTVPVTVPNYLQPMDVCGVLNRLINIGLEDAAESADDRDLEDEARAEATEATQITIGEPFIEGDDYSDEPF